MIDHVVMLLVGWLVGHVNKLLGVGVSLIDL